MCESVRHDLLENIYFSILKIKKKTLFFSMYKTVSKLLMQNFGRFSANNQQ